MPTPQKEVVVKEMSEKFSAAKGIFLADFTGIDVNTISKLRKGFRESEIEYRIVKNTLAKLSFSDAGIVGMDDYLTGVNSYVISYDDPTQPVKVVEKFKKELEGKFAIKAAYLEGQIISSEQVSALVNLPGKQELMGQIAGLLLTPMSKLVSIIQTPARNIVGVLKALEDKESK